MFCYSIEFECNTTFRQASPVLEHILKDCLSPYNFLKQSLRDGSNTIALSNTASNGSFGKFNDNKNVFFFKAFFGQ